MKRHNRILAGILVVQIVLSVVVFWPKSTVAVENELLFPDLEVGDIVALTITDADGKSIALQQVSGEWVLADTDGYPAQGDKTTPLLEKVAGLATDRLVTRTDASHKRLQVASSDFVRRVELETAEGTKYTLYLGSSPRYGATHFRLDGQSEAYLTSDITVWDVNTAANLWIDTFYLNVSQADITKLTLENQNGTFIFTKDTEGKWTMDGLAADEILSEADVTAVVRQVATVNMLRPLGKEEQAAYGMDAPNAVVTIETADKTVTLHVGAQDPDDENYVVTSSESPYYVRVSEYNVNRLVENARDDFLEAAPMPTPEGEDTDES